jgi:hypothetical protein
MNHLPGPFTVLPFGQPGALAPDGRTAGLIPGDLIPRSAVAGASPEAQAIRLPEREAR